MKKERKGRISEELYVLTIVFSTERELFTRQEGHNSRRNIYSAVRNITSVTILVHDNFIISII